MEDTESLKSKYHTCIKSFTLFDPSTTKETAVNEHEIFVLIDTVIHKNVKYYYLQYLYNYIPKINSNYTPQIKQTDEIIFVDESVYNKRFKPSNLNDYILSDAL